MAEDHSGFKALADIDMNTKKVINLGAPVNPNDSARLVDLPAAASSSFLCGGIGDLTTAQNATKWWGINSVHQEASDQEVADSKAQVCVPVAGTLQNLRVYMTTRGHAAVTFMVRINGANSGITVVCNADNTLFSDAVNTAAVVAGDRISMQIGTTDDAGNTICSWGIEVA